MIKTRIIDWAVCIGAFLVGCLFISVKFLDLKYGTTPQSELTIAQGAAHDVSSSNVDGRDHLRFTVSGQTVDYSSDLPGYSKVLAAIEHGVPMTLGVSTKRETLFPRQGWVALYTLAIGDETLLTYDYTLAQKANGGNAAVIVGAVLLLASGWGLRTCIRQRHGPIITPEQLAAAWRSPKRIRTATIFFSTIIYVAVICVILHPDPKNPARQVFGDAPLGIPLPLFLVLFITLLFIPFPIGAWYLYSIIFRRMAANVTRFKEDFAAPLLSDSDDSFDRRKSLTIVICVAVFYLALMIGWIVYADSHGL